MHPVQVAALPSYQRIQAEEYSVGCCHDEWPFQ
jgi:hypothetical protein